MREPPTSNLKARFYEELYPEHTHHTIELNRIELNRIESINHASGWIGSALTTLVGNEIKGVLEMAWYGVCVCSWCGSDDCIVS